MRPIDAIDIDDAYTIVFEDLQPCIILSLDNLDEHQKHVLKSRLELLLSRFCNEFDVEVAMYDVH